MTTADKQKCQSCLKELDNRIEEERGLCHKCNVDNCIREADNERLAEAEREYTER